MADNADCRTTIAPAPSPSTPAGSADPVVLIRNDSLAQLPVALSSPAVPSTPTRYDTVDMYLAGTPVPAPAEWRAAMVADGFQIAEAIGYQAGPDVFGAEALDFSSPEAAMDFQRKTMNILCDNGLIEDLRTIPGVPGAFAFIRRGSGSAFRSSVVAGNAVVHVNVCSCVEAPDLLDVASRWGQSVARQLGAH